MPRKRMPSLSLAGDAHSYSEVAESKDSGLEGSQEYGDA